MSQLLEALLQFALASFMYVQKMVHKQFSVLMGPWDSSGLLIFFVVKVLNPHSFHHKFSRDKVCSFHSDSKLVTLPVIKQRVLDKIGQ